MVEPGLHVLTHPHMSRRQDVVPFCRVCVWHGSIKLCRMRIQYGSVIKQVNDTQEEYYLDQ